MLSSWLPWDFFNINKSLFNEEKKIITLQSYDPFLEKMALSLPVNSMKDQWSSRKVISLASVDDNWFENNILTNDLFSESEAYLFIQSDQASKKLKSVIIENIEKVDDRLLIFSFNKNDDFYKELSAKDFVQGLQIKEPMFWQFDKLFDFLSSKLKVYLSLEVRNYLIESIKQETHEVINVLKTIKINTPQDRKLNISEIKELVKPDRLNTFKLLELYGSQNFIGFFKEIFKHDFSFDEYRTLFSILQSHLIKIYDPSYMLKKNRPSKYDKQIQLQSQKWEREEVSNHLKRISKFEILAKSKSPMLIQELRQDYFQNL